MDVIINADRELAPPDSQLLATEGHHLLNFLRCAGYDANYLPIADLLRQYHQLEGEWLVMMPVHWQATHNDAMIIAFGNELALSEEESRALFNQISTFLQEDGLDLYYHDANTWLVNLKDKPSITSKPVWQMQNQSMMSVLATMDKSLYWQRLLTELQMLLNADTTKEQSLRLPVNGVWFFGNGTFSWPVNRDIMTDDEQLLTHFSPALKPLDFDKPIANNAILLINYPEKINIDWLETTLSKQKVSWFWNNIAYSTAKKSWWKWFAKG